MGNLDRIRHDQGWLAEGGFSVTNLGNLDRIRHDLGLADGGFSVMNLGNLDRIRPDQGLNEGGFSVTNLGNLDRLRHRHDQGFPLVRQQPQLELGFTSARLCNLEFNFNRTRMASISCLGGPAWSATIK